METGSSGQEILSDEECLALLGAAEIGRVGIISDGQPLVFPVNYVCDGRSIMSAPTWARCSAAPPWHGWLSRSTASTPPIEAGGASWSRGRATTSPTPSTPTSEHLQTVELSPWAPGSKPRLLRIDARTITGRRFGGEHS